MNLKSILRCDADALLLLFKERYSVADPEIKKGGPVIQTLRQLGGGGGGFRPGPKKEGGGPPGPFSGSATASS